MYEVDFYLDAVKIVNKNNLQEPVVVRPVGHVSGAGSWPGRSGTASAAAGQISRSTQAAAIISVPQPAVFKVR